MTVRRAGPADVAEVLLMISELAKFENLADEVRCTEADLQAALFGEGATVTVDLVLAEEGAVAGYALWFPTFSTFLGRAGIWLEDLYVRPSHRRRGLAAELLAHLRTQTSGRVEWEVLDWNENAIALYDRIGARPFGGWTKYRWAPEG